jgi:hypothetical protein
MTPLLQDKKGWIWIPGDDLEELSTQRLAGTQMSCRRSMLQVK